MTLRHLSLVCSVLLLAASARAQQTLLEEDFTSGIFPPAGWSETNNGNSPGWELVGDRALHDDYVGFNDNWLVLPELDASGVSALYLHAFQGSAWSSYRDRNTLQLSLDGGASWQTIYREETIGDGSGQSLELDLSPLAGIAAFTLAFRYQGDFANEWSLEWLQLDDAPPGPQIRWPELPSSSLPASGYAWDFESGAPPSNGAINEVDELTRQPDPRAWCNLGQHGPNLVARGTGSLEMGLRPDDPGLHYSANALVLGLHGAGVQRYWLECEVLNHGEEQDPDDGIALSLDGQEWVAVLDDWDAATGGFSSLGKWRTVRVPLGESGVDLTGEFLLALGQADNRAYGGADGVALDRLRIWAEPLLTMQHTGAGNAATISVEHALPGMPVTLLVSWAGPGPKPTPWGLLDLSPPITNLGTQLADAAGQVSYPVVVPLWLSGRQVWLHASMNWDGLRAPSNPLTVQF